MYHGNQKHALFVPLTFVQVHSLVFMHSDVRKEKTDMPNLQQKHEFSVGWRTHVYNGVTAAHFPLLFAFPRTKGMLKKHLYASQEGTNGRISVLQLKKKSMIVLC